MLTLRRTSALAATATLLLSLTSVVSQAEPAVVNFSGIDCAKDYGPAVDAICRNDGLRFLDDKIAQRYSEAYARAWWVGKRHLKSDQLRFLASRDACGADTSCLMAILKRRVQTVGVTRWS